MVDDTWAETFSPFPRQVLLFGPLQLTGAHGAIQLPGGQVQSLFAYLLLHPGTSHTRERLALFLWPDAPVERAGRNLSNVLYRLRGSLGEGWFALEGDQIALHRDGLWVDVWQWERLVESQELEQVEQSLELYRDDLLPELYDDWLLNRRTALREQYLWALDRVAGAAAEAGDQERAFRHYHRLSHADPLNEAAHQGLMRLYARQGRPRAAMQQYARLGQLLADEMALEPLPETRLLAEQIRAEQETALADAPPPQPFVGRRGERALLLQAAERAQAGRGSLALVEGEPGVGKSSLLERVAEGAAWRGLAVAWGRATELAAATPYIPLDEALQSLLAGPGTDRLRQQLSPLQIESLAPLVPRLRTGPPLRLSRRPDLSEALSEVLPILAETGSLLLILDDVQWAGAAFWRMLDFAGKLERMPILLVLSYRSQQLRADAAAWQALRHLDLEAAPLRLSLDGLTLGECADLAEELGHTLSDERALALHEATDGNPFMVQEALAAGDFGERFGESRSLLRLVQDRLAALQTDDRRALEIAAVLGREFSHGTWQAAAGSHVLAAIPALLAGRFIQEAEQGYLFSHDLTRHTVYQSIPAARLQRWHEQAFRALQQEEADPETLLWHAEQGGLASEVARYALLAGERALADFAYETAAARFTQALAALPGDDLGRRYTAIRGRLHAWATLARREEQAADLLLLHALAGQLDDPQNLAEAAGLQARFYWQVAALVKARSTAEEGLRLAQQIEDPALQAYNLETLGQTERDLGNYEQARRWLKEAGEQYQLAGNPVGQATILDLLGTLAQRSGDFAQAIELYAESGQLARQAGDRLFEVTNLGNLMIATWKLGDYPAAREAGEQALQLGRELGAQWVESAMLTNLGSLAAIMGDFAAALDYLEQAQAICRKTKNTQTLASVLLNTGRIHADNEQFEKALPFYDEALALNREMGRKGSEAYVLHNRGTDLRELGRYAAARADLEAACALREELGEANTLYSTAADLVLVYAATGDLKAGKARLGQALQAVHPEARQEAHYAAYRLYQAAGDDAPARTHLRQAQAAMLAMADALSEEERARFLAQNPLNRRVQAAVENYRQQIQVRLVRADVPIGRPLADSDYVGVTWTVSFLEDETITPPAARRGHVLQRLLAEALAQGAAPTDADLANALGVSRRTVLRDMQALGQAGIALPTRRRPHH